MRLLGHLAWGALHCAAEILRRAELRAHHRRTRTATHTGR